MARALARLKAVTVARAKKPGLLADGGGLYLRIGPSGAKSWVFRYRRRDGERKGKLRDMGLGASHSLSLVEAREEAERCRKLLLRGTDPIEARRSEEATARVAAASAIPFRHCAESYIASHRAGWRNAKHAEQWEDTLERYVYPVFGDLPAQAVDTGLVLKVLEPMWAQKPETASRVRGRIESILDWATVRGYRQGENPARWRGHLDKLLPKLSKAKRAKREATGRGEHYAAMPYQDLPAFMAELRGRAAVSARALEFTILTAKRTQEVLGARWTEINLSEKTWTIPAGRMKGEREHRVPLSGAAIAVLESIKLTREIDPKGFIFPGARAQEPLSNVAMLYLLQRSDRMNRRDVTVHGFRSSFRDWAAERTNFASEAAEMALAHIVSDKVEAAYRRGDLFEKRRQLAEAWAKFCESPAGAGEVVPIRAAAQ